MIVPWFLTFTAVLLYIGLALENPMQEPPNLAYMRNKIKKVGLVWKHRKLILNEINWNKLLFHVFIILKVIKACNPPIAIDPSIINSGNPVDTELIPHTLTPEGCKTNRNYREFQLSKHSPTIQTCVCEDHCSWDMCNLAHAPHDCLMNVTSRWQWDYFKDTWVAPVSYTHLTLPTICSV